MVLSHFTSLFFIYFLHQYNQLFSLSLQFSSNCLSLPEFSLFLDYLILLLTFFNFPISPPAFFSFTFSFKWSKPLQVSTFFPISAEENEGLIGKLFNYYLILSNNFIALWCVSEYICGWCKLANKYASYMTIQMYSKKVRLVPLIKTSQQTEGFYDFNDITILIFPPIRARMKLWWSISKFCLLLSNELLLPSPW